MKIDVSIRLGRLWNLLPIDISQDQPPAMAAKDMGRHRVNQRYHGGCYDAHKFSYIDKLEK